MVSNNSIDINPPEIPRPSSMPLPEKKSFFGRKQKVSVEAKMLKDQLTTDKKPSIQESFEEQVASEASHNNLEEKVAEVKERIPLLTYMGGKQVMTLSDLQKALQEVSPDEFKRLQADGTYGLFIKRFLFHPELAGKVQAALSKQEALQAIIDIKKPRVEHVSLDPESIDSDEPEEHFSRLRSEHQESMQTLQDAVQEDVEETSVDIIRQALALKDKQTAETLYDVAEAISLMDDKAFDDLIITRKADLKAYIIELARKCARIAHIKPVELQARLTKDLEEHDHLITQKIDRADAELKILQATLDHRADSLNQMEKSLFKLKDDLVNEENRLEQVQQKLDENINEREAVVVQKEIALQAEISNTEEYKKVLAKSVDSLRSESEKLSATILQKQEEARQIELSMVEERKAFELKKNEVTAQLDDRRKSLDTLEKALHEKEMTIIRDKELFEESMQKRERLVQDTVDKILSVDKDIHEQRDEIDRMKDEIDHGGFKDYLENALKEVSTDHLSFDVSSVEKEFEEQHEPIAHLITSCNKAIEAKEFVEAKKLYAQLKKMYEQEKLTQIEKDVLYDAIRELYANLHLAILNN